MEQRVSCAWADRLPADTAGIVATFLDPADALNYAFTAGPRLSRTIKVAYLNKNFKFLCENFAKPIVFRAFLEVNEDWRNFYDDPGLLSLTDQVYFDRTFNDIRVAIVFGQVQVVRHLIEERGVDINEKVDRGDDDATQVPLFFLAIQTKNVPVLQYLLGKESLDVNAEVGIPEMEGQTCLHWLAFRDASLADEASLLLSHPAIDVNAADQHGNTVLHLAVWTPNSDILCQLLSREDVDVNAAKEHGVTALHLAVWTPNVEILSQLLSHEDIDVNATDNEGWTPLLHAVYWWREGRDLEENVKHLIEAGADPWLRSTNDGDAPFDLATEEQTALMREWIDNGGTHSDNGASTNESFAEERGGVTWYCAIL